MRPSRTFWTLLAAVAIPALAALTALALAAESMLRSHALEQLAAELSAEARMLAVHAAPQIETAAVSSACQIWTEAPDRFYTLISAQGLVLCEVPAVLPPGTDLSDRPEVLTALDGTEWQERRYNLLVSEDILFVTEPVRNGGRVLAVIRAGAALGSIDATVQRIRAAAAKLALAALAGAAGLAWVIARRMDAPLRGMEQAARRFGQGQLDERVPLSASPELRALQQALNEMAGKLDQRMHEILARRNEQDAVFSSMMEGVLAVDTRSNVINLNRVASELFGVDLAGSRGRNLLEIVRNPDLRHFVQETLSSDGPTEREIELHDGVERILNAHGTILLDTAGGRMGALVVLNDVTRLRLLERMRRDFAANVSHELKTPITSIKGFVETLLDGAMGEVETTERFLKIIARQADRLSGIIDDLLQLSRIERETEHREVSTQPHHLVEVLRGAVEICQPLAEERGILIELDCPVEPVLPLNAALLESAVVNLIDNAVKYSEPKGRVRVSIQEEVDEIAIAVQDWGRGIAPNHLPRLFERFYRVDPSRDRKAGGSGLGLAIVKHIAQAHGGHIDVRSKVGEGSTFYLHLPKSGAARLQDARAS